MTEEAFKLGYEAKSILDNPFNGNDVLSDEADCARAFVDGFVKKCQESSSTT